MRCQHNDTAASPYLAAIQFRPGDLQLFQMSDIAEDVQGSCSHFPNSRVTQRLQLSNLCYRPYKPLQNCISLLTEVVRSCKYLAHKSDEVTRTVQWGVS